MHASFFARAIRLGSAARLAAALVISGTAAIGCSSDTTTTTTPQLVSTYSAPVAAGTVATADSTPLVVLVSDGDSHGVSGVQVTFVAAGGAVLSSTSATTDANGLASVNVTLGTVAGTESVTATVSGLVTPPAVFTLTANPGAPAAIIAEAGNNQSATAGSSVALVAVVTDQYGNPVPNATIDWSTTAGTLTPVEVSDSTGSAADVLQLPATPAVVTATATVDGTSIKASFVDTSM